MSEPEKVRVWGVLHRRGASIVCPVCGFNEWKGFGELGNLHVALPSVLPTGELMHLPDQTGAVPAYLFGCARCGFLRLHSKQIVDDEFTGPEQKPD